MTADSISFTPTPDQYGFTFGGLAPVLTIDPGTVLTLWCEDAYGGRIRSADDLATGRCPRATSIPKPVRSSSGRRPGDVVAFTSWTSPARSWGVSTLIPYFGGLTSTPQNASLHPPLPERTWFYEYDSTNHTVGFAARASDFTVTLPASMMLGTVGVAPARAKSEPRWFPTTSAATWTPRRCAPEPLPSSAPTWRVRCCPSAMVTTDRARASPVARPSRVR